MQTGLHPAGDWGASSFLSLEVISSPDSTVRVVAEWRRGVWDLEVKLGTRSAKYGDKYLAMYRYQRYQRYQRRVPVLCRN